jgi:hypothetical protein
MNERIRKLAGQAKFMAEEDINRQISYNAELKAFAEKFAELIVRECVGILETEIADVLAPKTIFNQDEWDKNNMCFTLLVNMITLTKEHFGVK